MKSLMVLACALSIGLSACVENEEEITIRPDGSASVRLAAKGKVEDLSDGYGLPLSAPWIATTPDTSEWLRRLGSDTGSPAVRENARHWDTGRNPMGSEQALELEVRAEFASVKDWPRWFAPESEVYRSAYLEHGASLRVEPKSGHRLYTFERTYGSREFERFDLWSRIKRSVSEKLLAKLETQEQGPTMTPEECAKLVQAAVEAIRRTSRAFASDALLTAYTSGDGSLSTAKVETILAYIQGVIAGRADDKRVSEVLAWEFDPSRPSQAADDPRSGQQLESEIRNLLRQALGDALRLEGVPIATQHAILGELEWHLTAYDATCDLADESFKVTVHMPGQVVGGNCDTFAGGDAVWEFKGADLQDRERVLRVVSVVE